VARALDAHVCRCTGYLRIADAISSAGVAWRDGTTGLTGVPRRAAAFGGTEVRSRATAADDRGVGASLARYRGIDYALGAKPFVADLRVNGMLHGAVVLSAHPRSRVLAIDPAPALALPGVTRVLTAADVPGLRQVGLIVNDWPVFVAVGETTRCVGDVLAVVVADTRLRERGARRSGVMNRCRRYAIRSRRSNSSPPSIRAATC
jgi:xanthine dehydrogenase molybdenum-binding subunit